MSNMRRSKRLVALAAGLSLVAIAAACGDDDDDSSAATTAPSATEATPATTAAAETPRPPSADATETTEGGRPPAGAAPTGDAAMTVTVDINPDAVWEDGTPITWEDFECTWQAHGQHAGLDRDGRLRPDHECRSRAASDKQVIVELPAVYGPYKTLFSSMQGPIIKKAAVADCMDISADFSTEMPISGRAVKLESWSESQSVFVPERELLGRRQDDRRPGRHRAADGHGHRDRLDQVRPGRLHLPAVQRRRSARR